MLGPPYPDLDRLLEWMGQAGKRLADIGASEGAAGNLTLCIRWPIRVRTRFHADGETQLPQDVPKLAGAVLLVTGSGCRLREIINDPTANVACLVIGEEGRTAKVYAARHRNFERVTSEFASHLAVHYQQVCFTGTNFHAIIHAQPVHLTYLSHIPPYQDENYLNARLLRWQPETIINLPEGFGFIPFSIPGSAKLTAANSEALREHQIVIWAKHGVMARSEVSVQRALDLVEYAERAAEYEYLDLGIGGVGEGLGPEELRNICKAFNVRQTLF